MNKTPRLPNAHELDQLAAWLADMRNETPRQEHLDDGQNGYAAVFDNYTTDSPGYRGKVMAVVWPGDPSIHSVFTWDDHGQLDWVEPD